jgi:hypothetical protein
MISAIDLDEAKYNARDVLSMCRAYPHLVDAADQLGTIGVYEVDEQMAELALQMTRVGMPVNSERRQEIGDKLCRIRDEAIEALRPYTEGDFHNSFLDWVAQFFATKARKGEPINGSLRIGPTQAQATLTALQTNLKEWKEYRKAVEKASVNSQDDIADLAAADQNIAELTEQIKVAKAESKAAQFEDDANNGLIHTEDSAFAIRKAIRRADAELAISKKGVNFGAKVQQAAILRAAGVPLTKTTGKSGLPQVDKEVLAGFQRHEAAKALLKYTLVKSTITVYMEGEKRAGKGGTKSKPVLVTESGYIHPEWNIHKISGRWGSSPNVQNWSKHAGGGAENLRTMIEAPQGYIFVGADQKQLEARLVGAMSQCRYLLDVFARNEDVHGAFAAIGFPDAWPALAATFKAHKQAGKCKCEVCLKRDLVRDLTKRMEYGCIYGGKAQTIWEAIVGDFGELTLRQVQFFLQSFDRTCPEVLQWRQQTLLEAQRDGVIRSPILGRCQLFPLNRCDPTVAYNYKAQSGGADLWALGAIDFCNKWSQYKFDARICHNGHDSVLILCREEFAKEVEQDVYRSWNRTWNGVQFEMECKIGKRWSEV